ncbi:TnpV protein [Fusobacterium ulcerans]|uniref:TnpV protein n=1 Tax=Fusobacterium ulcerans TaxID=861 RepID=UPI0034E959E5
MTEITYTRQGDYNLPNLLPPQEEPVPHGKYALLRKKFLKEHRRVTYTNLLTSGKLNSHLAEIQQTAQRRMELIQRDPSAEHARHPFPIHFDPSIPAGFPFEKGKIKKSIDKSLIIY